MEERSLSGPILWMLREEEDMIKKVLFPVDFSPFSDKMLECAGELASIGMKEMVLLHVIDTKPVADYGDYINPALPRIQEVAEAKLKELEESLRDVDVEIHKVLRTGSPAPVIVETAKEMDASMIYIGGHGKGFLDRLILGSVSEKVLRLSDRPVLVQQYRVRGKGDGVVLENACARLLERVLIASDFSEYTERMKPVILQFVSTFCAPVTLLHVQEGRSTWGWDTVYRFRKKKASENMRKLQELAMSMRAGCPDVSTELVTGDPSSWILRIAEEVNASLIMIGAFGHRTVGSLLGGVAEKVVRQSERPVLVVKV